jgi:outer membrane protein assembly factor BamE (lipoprotein component of BamABCDE complex)
MRNLLAIVALALSSVLLTGCDRIVFGEQTKFSLGYSERKFQQIKQGMTVQEVVSSLGPPLNQRTQQWSEVWSYTPPETQRNTSRAKDGTSTFNLFGKVTYLRFTEAGLVERASGDFLEGNFVGLTKQQVQEKLGEPSQREVEPFEIIFHYTEPGKSGSGTYKRREVHFDTARKVSSVVAATYYD